jgi:anti-anti-sigma factor
MNEHPHIYAPKGRMDASNAAAVEKEILSHLEAAQYQLVIDLSLVEYLSSAGLRALLVAAKTAKQHGGQTILAAPRPAVAEVFKMSGFEKIMKITAHCDDALALITPT